MAILLLAWLGMAPAAQAEAAKTGAENEQQGLSRLLDSKVKNLCLPRRIKMIRLSRR
jgi:hypothetical protein